MKPLQPFTVHRGVPVPLLLDNVDTDAIIPSREIRRVSRDGLSEGLFANWRYLSPGGRMANPDFILNQKPWKRADILLGGANFGCGSSREQAVWALREYGFRAIIAVSFAGIFFDNCINNGILPVTLDRQQLAELATHSEAEPGKFTVTLDLERCLLIVGDEEEYPFSLSAPIREQLLKGLDRIELTMTEESRIAAFADADRRQRPWAYQPVCEPR